MFVVHISLSNKQMSLEAQLSVGEVRRGTESLLENNRSAIV